MNDIPVVRVAYCMNAGNKYLGLNQDAYLVRKIDLPDKTQCHIFGVFDGHNLLGELASATAAKAIETFFVTAISKSKNTDKVFNVDEGMMNEAFTFADKQIKQIYSNPPKNIKFPYDDKMRTWQLQHLPNTLGEDQVYYMWKKDQPIVVEFGTTCVVAVLCHNILTVGSAGDSQCFIVKESGRDALNIEELSVVHNTANPDEHKRIKECPVIIETSGYVRVTDLVNRGDHHLAMTRALGHKTLCKHGILEKPDVKVHKLTKNDLFIILATDGVWDSFKPAEVADIISHHKDPKKAVEEVVKASLEVARGNQDNTTAVIAFLQ